MGSGAMGRGKPLFSGAVFRGGIGSALGSSSCGADAPTPLTAARLDSGEGGEALSPVEGVEGSSPSELLVDTVGGGAVRASSVR